MNLNKIVLKNAFLVSAGGMLSSLLGFLSIIYIARNLSVSEFGYFSSALGISNLMLPMVAFGVPLYLLKKNGENQDEIKYFLIPSLRFYLYSLLSVVFILIAWAFFGPNDDLSRKILIIFSFYVIGQSAAEILMIRYQLENNFFKFSIVQFLPALLRFFLLLLVIYFSSEINPMQFSAVYALVGAIVFLFTFFYYLKINFKENINRDGREEISIFEILKGAFPFGLAGIFYLIYFQSGVIVLKYISGDEQAGIFSAAFVFMSAIYLIPSLIYSKVLLPRIHVAFNKSNANIFPMYKRGNIFMMFLGILSCIFIFSISDFLIKITYGDRYALAVDVLRVLCFAIPFRFLSTSIGAFLNLGDLILPKIKVMGAVAILNFLANIFLIKLYGAIGCALSVLLCDIALFIGYNKIAKKGIFNNGNKI